MTVSTGIGTNIDDSGGSRTNVLNSGPNGIVKETFRWNEKESTYGVTGSESGSKEIGDWTDGGFEEVKGYTKGGSKEVRGCTDGGSKKVGGCIDGGFEEVEGCIKDVFEDIRGYNDPNIDKVMSWRLLYVLLLQDVDWPQTGGNRAIVGRVGGLPPLCYTCEMR